MISLFVRRIFHIFALDLGFVLSMQTIMTAEVIIDNIRRKVRRLMNENLALWSDYEKACRQRDKLKDDNRELKQRIATLERRVSTLEIAAAMEGKSDIQGAKAHINRLMREVDKCIALLNKGEQI